MKKAVAIILALAAVFTLSFSCVAATNSPTGTPQVSVTIHSAKGIEGVTVEGTPTKVAVDTTVKVEKDDAEGKFESWSIYKPDGSLAKEGTDYTITAGDSKSPSITIVAKKDLIICGNYDGKITDPVTGNKKEPQSPPTSDATAIALTVVMLGAAAVVFGAKKQLCK